MVKDIIACDISHTMLEAVKRNAKENSLYNIITKQATAESLPFSDQQFDCVISRYSTHHWHNLAQGIKEIKRVLKPTGIAIIIDTIAPLDKATDSFLQTIELLRDHSHVRNYSLVEYINLFSLYELSVVSITQRSLALDFNSWINRTKPSEVCIQAIIELQKSASTHIQENLYLKSDHSFSVPNATFVLKI